MSNVITDDDLIFVSRYANGHEAYDIETFYAEKIDQMLNPYKEKGLIYFSVYRDAFQNEFGEFEVHSFINVLLTHKGHELVVEFVKSKIDQEIKES